MAKAEKAKPKPKSKAPKLTDAERHKRFVSMAIDVQASDIAEEFDRAFTAVTTQSKSK